MGFTGLDYIIIINYINAYNINVIWNNFFLAIFILKVHSIGIIQTKWNLYEIFDYYFY